MKSKRSLKWVPPERKLRVPPIRMLPCTWWPSDVPPTGNFLGDQFMHEITHSLEDDMLALKGDKSCRY
ncbi:MAG: hypothetical protein JXR49_09495 [Acidobacteria bacterium]|nr:hypothetical protein [Acidobacteriota bacterium]